MNTYVANINNEWYAFAANLRNDQCYSIGADNPPKESGGYCYVARLTTGGIHYVSSPSPNRKAAVAKAKRHGEYDGEIHVW